MVKELCAGKNHITLVDDEDFEYLDQWFWSFDRRYVYRKEYLGMDGGKQKYKKIYLHRLIMNTPEGFDTDHINHDKLDNRKENLRIVSRSQNNMNQRPQIGRTSKYKGVHWNKRGGNWKSEIKMNGKSKWSRVFKTEQEAVIAYNKAAKELFGEFANINIIQ